MIAGILVAAGGGAGVDPRALQAREGEVPLVRRVARRLLDAPLDELVVVVGADDAAVSEALRDLPLRIVDGAPGADGASAALHAGVRALPADAEAALLALGDQPGVRPSLVGALVTELRRSGLPIAAPLYGRELGTPVLVAASLFPELLALQGAQGMDDLVRRDPARVALVRLGYPMERAGR